MIDETTTTPVRAPAATDPEVERFLELIERARTGAAVDLVLDRTLEGETVTSIVQGLLAPAQRLVGERWHRGRYTVAHEHIVSGVVDDLLGLLAISTPRPGPKHTVALVCAEGEWHTTPARMAALCLRDAGWRVQFLGGSLPAEHLAASLRTVAPRAVAISCTLPLALAGVPALIDTCHDHQLPTIAGGIGFGPDDRRARHLGADGHALNIATASELLTDWLDRPPPAPTGRSQPAVDEERFTLTVDRTNLVTAAHQRLEQRLPAMVGHDEVQRRHTRQDVDDLLRFLDAALLVDDPRVFADFATWRRDLLEARRVPDVVLHATLDAVASTLPAHLSGAHAVLEHGRGILQDPTSPAGHGAFRQR